LILVRQLIRTDFKLRYQGSTLGYLWSILKPLFLFGILYIVFVGIVGVDYGVDNDGVYLLLGIVIWTFFAELTGGSVTSVVGKGDLIRKLNFPKYIIVFATGFSAIINLALNMAIVVVFMIITGITVNLAILFAPLLFLELFVFTMGIGFFLSTVFVKFRDVGYIWDVVMQALFYLTPILFPLAIAPLWVQKILMINPLAQVIQDLRYILVSTDTTTITDVYNGNGLMRLVPITISVVTFIVFAVYFRANSKNFAENI
jgi:ABC-2 type transport system permease protein